MGVVESEVLRPVPGLGQVQDSPQKRRGILPYFQWGDLHFHAVRQFSLRRQHHHAILDCALEAHAGCLDQGTR